MGEVAHQPEHVHVVAAIAVGTLTPSGPGHFFEGRHWDRSTTIKAKGQIGASNTAMPTSPTVVEEAAKPPTQACQVSFRLAWNFEEEWPLL